MTGQLQGGGKTFQQYAGQALDAGFLFDGGVDTVDLIVPGGGIAVKVAKGDGSDAAGSLVPTLGKLPPPIIEPDDIFPAHRRMVLCRKSIVTSDERIEVTVTVQVR